VAYFSASSQLIFLALISEDKSIANICMIQDKIKIQELISFLKNLKTPLLVCLPI